MDLNTILFIAFAVMMLFCCGGLGRLFSRSETGDHCGRSEQDKGGAATSATDKSAKRGGCCH